MLLDNQLELNYLKVILLGCTYQHRSRVYLIYSEIYTQKQNINKT